MRINCFSARAQRLTLDDDRPEPPRPAHSAKKHFTLKRSSTGESHLSTTSSKSNESISKLPPCKRGSDPKVDAMMMPVPHDPRPSRCLRLSHPRIYSSLVYDMKASKKSREWREFPVFFDDDVDESTTADEAARKKAIEYQRKVRQLNSSFPWSDKTCTSHDTVDMIG